MRRKCLLVVTLLGVATASPLLGAQGYRDFHPLAIDTRDATPPTMQGYVFDEFNERAIRYARVRLVGAGGHADTCTTGANGFFAISDLEPTLFPGGIATLTVEHDGYWTSEPAEVSIMETATVHLRSKTVILLHGLAGSYGNTWGGDGGPFPRALAHPDSGGFRVVGADMGGFPGNVLPVSSALNTFRLALEANCHQLGIQSYDMVGHSMGGLVGRSYATKSYGRNRINKLVTLGTPHHGANIANALSAPSRVINALTADFICWVSGGFICPDAEDLPVLTALHDLRIGSPFLNSLNYGVDQGSDQFNPCRSTFGETTDHYETSLYSIAGTQPGGWRLRLALPFLGCQEGFWRRWAESDGIVLRPRAYFHKGDTCTDVRLGCPGTHHKSESVGLTKSECLARVVRDLLKSDTFTCAPAGKAAEEGEYEGFIPSRLPRIETTVLPGATRVDSTLINAINLVDFLCVSTADSLVYTLRSPSGRIIDPAECELDPDLEYIRGASTAYYSIQNPEAGTWRHQITCVDSTEPQFVTIDAVFDGAVVLAAETTTGIDPDGTFVLKAEFTDAGLSIPTGAVTAMVTRPDDTTEQVELFDEGFGADEIAGDGFYAASYPAAGQAGTYGFVFRGDTDPGDPQSELREAVHVASAARLPDLAIAEPGLVIDDMLVPKGGLVALTAGFTNLGTATADSVLIRLSNVSYNVTLAETLLVDMAPGQTIVLQTQWLAVAEGTFTLRAGIDVIGEQNESRFANNGSEVVVTVFVPEGVAAVPGDGGVGGPDGDAGSGTSRILLYSSFPNPLAAGSTSIRFQVPQTAARADLTVFDIRGRRVKLLVSEVLPQGEHARAWDGSDDSGRQVASGVYFCRLQVAGEVQIKKMVVVR